MTTKNTVSSRTPGPAPRAGRPRDPASDRAILAAAFELLRDIGYQGLSIEAVAAAAGVAKTTIYRRYASKRELVVAALLAGTAFPPPPADPGTRDALRELVHQGVGMLLRARAVRILASFLSEEEREPELMAAFRERIVEPRRAMLTRVLRAGIERGEVRPDADIDLVSEMVLGSVIAHHVRTGRLPDDRWMESLVEALLRSVEARPNA
ncbi:MAG: TetR/AcrR family transcriptional regulator [Candidatus Limnocylindria bacterium]